MKFTVSARDFAIFAVFCVFLFYICAIGVLNFSDFARTGEFHGLNPFPAFTKDYFAATLIFFIIVLVIIFTSVSSYIFKKDKGSKMGLFFGEKNEKGGYSRWANAKEIKNDKWMEHIKIQSDDNHAAGIPLINNGKDMWVDNGEYHNLVIGATGSGKTETIVKPMVNILARKGESMILMDPKGEIYRYSADNLRKKGYNVIVLNFREPHLGNAWNPLTLPYQYYKAKNFDKSNELLEDVALNILYDPDSKDTPFWEKSASDYFSGLALGLFEDAKEEEINLNSISIMSSVGDEKFAASTYIKEYFTLKGEASSAYIFAANTINAPNETKGGIVSTFRQKIRQFASRENLSEMLAYSDFDVRDIGKGKTAVFIIIHDEKTTYHGLATIFIKQVYETLIDEAQRNNGKLPFRTNFILDEFANMPPLKDIDAMVTAARSRDIRFTFIIQNYGQLKEVYGDKDTTIKGNCGNLIYLISTELSALEEISKMAGEVKSEEKEKSVSTPLISVTELQKLKLFESIIIRWRMFPFRTKFTPDFEMNWGFERVLAEHVERPKKEIKLFDVKTFVKEEKRKKLFDTLEKGKDESSIPPFPSPNFDVPNSNNTMPPLPSFAKESESNSLPFNSDMPSNFDIDAMIKDIDAKIAELDKKEEMRKKYQEEKKTKKVDVPSFDDILAEISSNTKETEKQKEVIPSKIDNEISKEKNYVKKEEKKEIEKPNVKVDVDSVIVNENITDDQFFDDFFGDD